MRIGLVLPGFSASERDWCIPALLNLVRTLAATPGVDLEVFPLRYPARRDDYVVHGARVHPQGGGNSRRLRRIGLMVRTDRAIRHAHRRARFDLLHAYWADEPGLVATFAAARLGIPSLVSLAGGELANEPEIGYGGQIHRSSRLMVDRALRGATHVTTGSLYLTKLAAARVAPDRLSLLPFGVDTALFTRVPVTDEQSPFSPIPADGVHILHVASLVPIKDQRLLIAAFAQVVRAVPNAHLQIIGEGPLCDALMAQTKGLSLQENVHFHGPVDHHELPRYYRSADFCVLSSRYEAQGMVILEAAACGVATVGTALGLLPDLSPISIIPPGGEDALAHVILELVTNESRRRKLGDAARCLVEYHYTLRSTVERQLELYRSLIVSRN
ncbi:MAG TPA: glycosyltransferase family 4 protein [Nitrolancea sp.]